MSIQHIYYATLMAVLLILGGCSGDEDDPPTNVEPPGSSSTNDNMNRLARYVPGPGETMMIIGQDYDTVEAYKTACVTPDCPVPAAVTFYLGLFNLLNPNVVETIGFSIYGGLGEDPSGNPAAFSDWGSGRTSGRLSANDNPNSAIAIGLNTPNPGLGQIPSGMHDNNIIRLADFIASRAPMPVYLRIGFEFDGNWNNYDPTEYINAWRYIVDMLDARGINNAEYVWQASAAPLDDNVENGLHENIEDWYPGDAYVSWMALSWFIPPDVQPAQNCLGGPPNTTITARQLADELLAFARAKNKPVMIAESAPAGFDIAELARDNTSPCLDGPTPNVPPTTVTADDIWNDWYVPYFTYINSNLDIIKAVAYINTDWQEQEMWECNPAPGNCYAGFWGDSRIEANTTIQANWVNVLSNNDPLTQNIIWLHGGTNLLDNLGSFTP